MPESRGIDRTLYLPEVDDDLEVDKELRIERSRPESFREDAAMAIGKIQRRISKIREYIDNERVVLTGAHDEVATMVNTLPTVETLPFFQDNVAANQTDQGINDGRGGRGYVMLDEGSIVGIVVRSNEARTAGTLTVEAAKNGTKVGLTAVLDATNTTKKATIQAADLDTFVGGDIISAVITTDASWAPTTADIDVSVAVSSAPGLRYSRQ